MENKQRHKDVDGSRAEKSDESHCGSKDHVKADKDSEIIICYTAVDAGVCVSMDKMKGRDTGDMIKSRHASRARGRRSAFRKRKQAFTA